MKRILYGVGFFLVILGLIAVPMDLHAKDSKGIIVSAAADLIKAFKEIGGFYEKETGNKVIFNFGSTGMAAKQIEAGAPVDLFFAANKSYIDGLQAKGLIHPETKTLYAVGRITLATPKGTAKLNFIKDLLDPRIKRIAIANPGHAPYGLAAKEAMQKAGVWDAVKHKIVMGETVRQALDYVETGNVDAGIVALSVSIGSKTEFSLIPEELHNSIEQAMAVIKSTKNKKQAIEFANYVNSPKGRQIMKKYGFVLPSEMK
ncbi:MAG: molybdate ABC transporter substrate-binding protein [Nitrospirae bacterium]|nr:molybdate ABC transporter substrate-binding protein [Nitrospirota bacterium]